MENRKFLIPILCFMMFFLFISAVSGEEDKLSLLLKQLDNPDSSVREQAVLSIGTIGDKRAINPLIQRLNVEKDIRVKKAIIQVFGLIKDARTFDIMLSIYKNDDRTDWTLVATVVESMGKLNDQRVVPTLIDVIKNDPSNRITEIAANALGELKDARAVSFLIAVVEKTDSAAPWVDAVVWALGEIRDSRAFPVLIKALEYKNFSTEGVALALGKIGDKRAIPALEKAYKRQQLAGIRLALKMLTGKDY